jgi:hypothetical protein
VWVDPFRERSRAREAAAWRFETIVAAEVG